jgi:hypothetical protein
VDAPVIWKIHRDRDYLSDSLSDLARLTDQIGFGHTHTLCLICDLFPELFDGDAVTTLQG